jgi:ribonuclease P protein component
MDAARLRRGEDIARVRADGLARNGTLFSFRSLPRDSGEVRIAVTATRAIGGAVARNRARRRVREAFRTALRERQGASGRDIVVSVRGPSVAASAAALRAAADRELDLVLA